MENTLAEVKADADGVLLVTPSAGARYLFLRLIVLGVFLCCPLVLFFPPFAFFAPSSHPLLLVIAVAGALGGLYMLFLGLSSVWKRTELHLNPRSKTVIVDTHTLWRKDTYELDQTKLQAILVRSWKSEQGENEAWSVEILLVGGDSISLGGTAAKDRAGQLADQVAKPLALPVRQASEDDGVTAPVDLPTRPG